MQDALIETLSYPARAEPSQVHPFIEPFLPYYDSIRQEPHYVEFVAEIQRD